MHYVQSWQESRTACSAKEKACDKTLSNKRQASDAGSRWHPEEIKANKKQMRSKFKLAPHRSTHQFPPTD